MLDRRAVMLRTLITIGVIVLLTFGAIALGVKFFNTSVSEDEKKLD